MRKGIIAFLIFMLPVVAICVEPIDFPNNPVLIAVGASNVNHQTPLNAPGFEGGFYAGGGARSLCDELTSLDLNVNCIAKGGAFSYDLYKDANGNLTPVPTNEIVWRGYLSQVLTGYFQTNWNFDTKGPRAKAVYFDPVNDCLGGPCNMDHYIANLTEAVNAALDIGLHVAVGRYLPCDKIDLERALSIYGFTDFMTLEECELLTLKHEAAFESRTDIAYLDVWSDYSTIDRLHADEKAQAKAARIVKKWFKEVTK